MNDREALDTLDAAAVALDAAWRSAPAGARRKRLRALIAANDAERIALINKLLAGTADEYEPITARIRGSGADLRWARQRVEEFQIAADQMAAIVTWATGLLALI